MGAVKENFEEKIRMAKLFNEIVPKKEELMSGSESD